MSSRRPPEEKSSNPQKKQILKPDKDIAPYWLAAIIESAEDAVISKTLEGIITSWNAGAERIFGYTADEAIGQPVTMLIPAERVDEEPSILRRLRAGERIEHYETERVRKDGTRIDISLTVSPIRAADGTIVGASKIARDITATRQTERTLREQAGIIQEAYDAIFLRDSNNLITLWNRGAERIYGYSPEEAFGRSPHELLRTESTVPIPEIYEFLRRDGYWEGELLHRRKDGEQLIVETRWATIRNAQGQETSILEITRDVTERKRAEEQLREQAEIIETVNRLGQTLAGELDLHRLVQSVTDAATGITGAQFGSFFYNVLDERGESYLLYALSGVPLEAFSSFPMPRNTEIFAPTFQGTGTVLIPDVKRDPRYGKNPPYYGMPEGHLPVTSYLAVPVISRTGEVYGGLFFGHPDEGVFSERDARIVEGLAAQSAVAMDNARLYEAAKQAHADAERAAAENERLYREAQESSRLKDEFLATVSHELRTPLTAILGWSHMLRTGNFNGDFAKKAFETIERNARAQSQLIDDLLDVSRIITGKLRIDIRPLDPRDFIDAAIEAVRPAAEAKGIHIQRIFDTANFTVSGDPVRLQQVIWNLLSNSVKFTPRDGRVVVRMERTNSQVAITISDTGAGIEPEFLPHVFDRFRQADQRTTRQHGGMGLGLSIVRHLVELHGGSVKAQSGGVGAGSEFTVFLPMAPIYIAGAEMARARTAATGSTLAYESLDRLDGIKILAVDDEPDTRELLKSSLQQCGADVRLAGSASEAIDAIREEVPGLLISDIGMPDEDGYELIRKVRSLSPEEGGRIPAIALTAYARVEDRMKALRAGYQMHVPKPVEMAELVAVALSLAKREK